MKKELKQIYIDCCLSHDAYGVIRNKKGIAVTNDSNLGKGFLLFLVAIIFLILIVVALAIVLGNTLFIVLDKLILFFVSSLQ